MEGGGVLAIVTWSLVVSWLSLHGGWWCLGDRYMEGGCVLVIVTWRVVVSW